MHIVETLKNRLTTYHPTTAKNDEVHAGDAVGGNKHSKLYQLLEESLF